MYEEEEENRSESVADLNRRITSQLELPHHLVVEIAENRRERKKIELVQAHSQRCREATDGMLSMLNDFSGKIKHLETIMMPVHDATFQLTLAQQRIDQLIHDVGAVKLNHEIAHESEASVSRRKMKHAGSDFKEYLDWVNSINSATAFWNQHKQYKGADKMLRRLREWSKSACAACEERFVTHLSNYSDAVDFTRLPWPLPSTFDTVPKEVTERMAQIAQIVDLCDSRAYLDAMVNYRGTALRNTVKRLLTMRQGNSTGDSLKTDSGKSNASRKLHEFADAGLGSSQAQSSAADAITMHLSAAASNALLNLGSGGSARAIGLTSQIRGSSAGNAHTSRLGAASALGGTTLRNVTTNPFGGLSTVREQSAAPRGTGAQSRVGSANLAGPVSRLGVENSTFAGQDESAAEAAVVAQTQANISALISRLPAASRMGGIISGASGQKGARVDLASQRSDAGARGRYLLEAFLRLLEAEFTFWTRTLELTSVSSQELSVKFSDMVTEAFDSFILALQQAVAERSPSRVFLLLDMLDDCQRFSPRYRALLDAGEQGHFAKYESFRLQIHGYLKTALSDYRSSVLQASKVASSAAKAGSTCSFTVDTLLGLRRLSRYTNAVNSLPETTIVDDPKLLQTIRTVQSDVSTNHLGIESSVGTSVRSRIPRTDLLLKDEGYGSARGGYQGAEMNMSFAYGDNDDLNDDENDDYEYESEAELGGKNWEKKSSSGLGAAHRRLGMNSEVSRSDGSTLESPRDWTPQNMELLPSSSSFSGKLTGLGWGTQLKRGNEGICLLADSILICLEQSLTAQAKSMTKWPALAPLFLLNNHFHMYKTILKSQLPASQGWVNHCSQAIARFRDTYRHVTWDQAIQCLTIHDESSPKLVSRAKKSLAKFDEYFTENYSVQRRFVVPDDEMRAQMRALNIETIVPEYKAFFERFCNTEGFEFKFRPEVIETMLNKFFDETN